MPNPKVQDLSSFKVPYAYTESRLSLRLLLWFFLGEPLLRSWLPGSPWRRALLRLFGALIGHKVVIKPHVRVKYPWLLQIGDYCWIGECCWIDNLALVRLEPHVCLSQGVYICTGNHNYRDRSFSYRLAPVTIEAEAWICAQSSIAPGVRIGHGAVLGLGSVALADLAPMMRYQGNPAQQITARLQTDLKTT